MSDKLPLLSPKNEPDHILWQQFREGDRRAFQQIYQKYLNELFTYGMKVQPHRNLVKDCLQDLFIDLWKNKENLSKTDNIKYYLFKALRRKITKDVVKKKRYYVERDVVEFSDTQIVFPFENKIIELQGQLMESQKLRKAVERLSDRQKEVINLIFYEAFSYEEVSNIMNINLRSVYTLVWKAISSLRKDIISFLALFILF
ncbi:sigma-70 family RNA polymerase sigma factor [Fulvivirgaceae bacterium BMA10]|uniref:Sigma-70 family RNA polymerase sigma factor n=1 Tax=Splendidivirga corallicola TaxID=3051826 RepID=A0ABT8KGN8_9BACT|nr:sigma-70 family RNA polymerase sigma factor [Fulvivirgaceae bacterium BMA10]